MPQDFSVYRTQNLNEAGEAVAVVAVGGSAESGIQAEVYFWFPRFRCLHGAKRFRYYTDYEIPGVQIDEAFMCRQALLWAEGEIQDTVVRSSNSCTGLAIAALREVESQILYDMWLHQQCPHLIQWIRENTRSKDLQAFLGRLLEIKALFTDDIPPTSVSGQ